MKRAAFICLGLFLACNGEGEKDTQSGTETATDSETSSTTATSSTATDSGTATTGPTTSATGTTSPTSTSGSGSDTGTSASGSDTGTGGVGPCEITMCGNDLYECGDCEDNDGDGKVDSSDPECVGPCDDDESEFSTGIPGDNMDPCNQDCFFDGDSGAGNDGCKWNLKCDPENPGGDSCPYDPNYKNCTPAVPQECLDSCPVPPGCDCFGCCTITKDGMDYDVFIGSPGCSIDMIQNCQPCTKQDVCDDPCEPEKCELCFGQDPEDLPDRCDNPECDMGEPCTTDNMGGDTCPDGFFCLSGCCAPFEPPP